MDRPSTPAPDRSPMQELLQGFIPSPTLSRIILESRNNLNAQWPPLVAAPVARYPLPQDHAMGYLNSGYAMTQDDDVNSDYASTSKLPETGNSSKLPNHASNSKLPDAGSSSRLPDYDHKGKRPDYDASNRKPSDDARNTMLCELVEYQIGQPSEQRANPFNTATKVHQAQGPAIGGSTSQAVALSGPSQALTLVGNTSSAIIAQHPSGLNTTAPRFVPTAMAQYGRGIMRQPTQQELVLRARTGMSANYRGDPSNMRNYGVPGLPDHLNTSFWICGLPIDITHHELLAGIQDCGRVWALHINNSEAGRTRTSAGAKLVFFSVLGTQRFARNYMHQGQLRFRGKVAWIRYNRDPIPEPQGWRNCSRCLRIRGPNRLADPGFILNFFEGKFEYELADVIGHARNSVYTDFEIQFGSYRAQAAMAYKLLKEDPVFTNDDNFQVNFAPDPCANFFQY